MRDKRKVIIAYFTLRRSKEMMFYVCLVTDIVSRVNIRTVI